MIIYITPDVTSTLAFKQCGIEGILTFTSNTSKINIIGTKEQFEFVMPVLKTTNLIYNNRIQAKEIGVELMKVLSTPSSKV